MGPLLISAHLSIYSDDRVFVVTIPRVKRPVPLDYFATRYVQVTKFQPMRSTVFLFWKIPQPRDTLSSPSLCILPGSDFEDRRHVLKIVEQTDRTLGLWWDPKASIQYLAPSAFLLCGRISYCVVKPVLLGVSIVCCSHKLAFFFCTTFFFILTLL